MALILQRLGVRVPGVLFVSRSPPDSWGDFGVTRGRSVPKGGISEITWRAHRGATENTWRAHITLPVCPPWSARRDVGGGGSREPPMACVCFASSAGSGARALLAWGLFWLHEEGGGGVSSASSPLGSGDVGRTHAIWGECSGVSSPRFRPHRLGALLTEGSSSTLSDFSDFLGRTPDHHRQPKPTWGGSAELCTRFYFMCFGALVILLLGGRNFH